MEGIPGTAPLALGWIDGDMPDWPVFGDHFYHVPSSEAGTRRQPDYCSQRARGCGCVLPLPDDTGASAMDKTELADIYRAYIACLNNQDWSRLGQFVDDDASHNGRLIGLSGYRAMLERDFLDIPDLSFNIQLLVSDPPFIASRLAFDCRPKGSFLGLPVNGRRVMFAENVFYEFRGGKVWKVWSLIDKAAIETQLQTKAP
jgi:predicted ester cyclase